MAKDEFIIPEPREPVEKSFDNIPEPVAPVVNRIESSNSPLSASFLTKGALLLKAAGLGLVKSKFYRVNEIEVQKGELKRQEFEEKGGRFGLPIFDTLTFSGDGRASADGETTVSDGALTYTNFDDETITVDPLRMDIVLITITQVKNIVKTPISGRNGTVKEYISDGDYAINIKGIFLGEYTDVEDRKNKLHLIDFCKSNISINCSSGYLQDFDINSLVVDKYEFKQVEGERSKTMFILDCSSDTPFEIEETKDAETT
jgi:hypothetical protein